MNTFKRVLAWIVIAISVIGIFICVLGIAGSWAINDSLTESVLNLVGRAETALVRVEDSLLLADAQLKEASAALATVREAGAKLGARIEKNSPVLDRISQILQDQLGPTVDKIRDAFLKIEERIQIVNNTIETLNALPGIQLSLIDLPFEGPKDRINLVRDAVQQLQENIADFRAGIVQSLAPFMEKIDTISAFLVRLEDDVKLYINQVNTAQAALERAKTSIPTAIDRLTMLLSIVFLWVILAQFGLLLLARQYLKTGQIIRSGKTVEAVLIDTTS